MLYVIIDGVEILVNKNLNSETSEMNIETLKYEIDNVECKITNIESKIKSKQSEIDNFEYHSSNDEFSDWIDSIYSEVSIGSLTFSPSKIMKELDPVAYRCGKSYYERNYDLDDCEEYTNLKDELDELENTLESFQDELSDLQDELDSLESED